jgi:hypothetical protein
MFFSIVWNKIEISPIYGFNSRGKSFGTIFNFLYINIYWSKYDFMINSWSYHNCLICPFLLCNYAPQFKCRNACLAIRGHTSFWCVLSNHGVMHRNCDKRGSHTCWKGPKIWNPKPTRQDLSFDILHDYISKTLIVFALHALSHLGRSSKYEIHFPACHVLQNVTMMTSGHVSVTSLLIPVREVLWGGAIVPEPCCFHYF